MPVVFTPVTKMPSKVVSRLRKASSMTAGWAYYLVGLGEYHEAIEIAEGTGYTLWARHRLLPILAEAYLWAGEIDKAEKIGNRIREHSNRLDHKLGHAWADACEALVMWKRGDARGAIALMQTAAEALDEIPMLWDSARIRRQMAGRMAEVGDFEGSPRSSSEYTRYS
jgi:hypothetical protein